MDKVELTPAAAIGSRLRRNEPSMRRSSTARRSSNGNDTITSDNTTQARRRRRRATRNDNCRQNIILRCAAVLLVMACVYLVGAKLAAIMSTLTTTQLPKASGIRGNSGSVESNLVEAPIHRDLREPFQRASYDAPVCDALDAKDVAFTLVTQLSVDRLWMLKHHCERWGNASPMSVAILTNQTIESLTDQLVQLGCDRDKLTVQTLSAEDYPPDDFPVNVMRNMALSVVQTSHVMYVDVDFWEAQDLHDTLYLQPVREALAKDAKRALVVPAFQLNRQCSEYRDCPEINVPRMPHTAVEVAELIKSQDASAFDPTNYGGHGSTLYSQWYSQEAGDLLDIPCIRSNRYEPYMAFRYCRDLPPYQERFSGYGKNKMTMVMHMRRSGYVFSQLGKGFVVHYPHLDSSSRLEWNQGPAKRVRRPKDVKGTDWTAFKRGRVDAVFVEFRDWLRDQVPDDARVPRCDHAEDDDARLWIDRSEE